MQLKINHRVCIVGSGVIGLTTAVEILEANPSCQLVILYDKDISETTSFGPVGLWRPQIFESKAFIKNWYKYSYHRHFEIANDPLSGAQIISGFMIGPKDWLTNQAVLLENIAINLRWLDKKSIDILLNNSTFEEGLFYTSVTVQGNKFLPWLIKRIISMNGRFIKRHVDNLDELFGEFDVVINCAGIGARSLAHDSNVYPIRGVLIQVDAPWVKHFGFIGCDSCYFIPGQDSVFLGGIRDPNNDNTEFDIADQQSIFQQLFNFFPYFKKAAILKRWVGLRPGRNGGPRVEEELKTFNGKQFLVVHNYGHAGNGFSLSWGCARHVAMLLYGKSKL